MGFYFRLAAMRGNRRDQWTDGLFVYVSHLKWWNSPVDEKGVVMKNHPEAHLTSRQRTRLLVARERGYLNARCLNHKELVHAFSLWCWLLRVPLVWQEGLSRRSRYGRLRLDMFTTANVLTSAGQTAIRALQPGRVTPHDAVWDRVPLRDLDRLARTVYRASTRLGNYEPYRSSPVVDLRRETPEILYSVA